MKNFIKTCFDFFIYIIFLIFISIFKLFPSNLKLKISEILGVFLFYAIPKGRKLSYKNLNLILNEQYKLNYSKKELKEIAIKSYRNTAKSFLLPFWIYEYEKNFSAKVYNIDLYLKLKEKTDRIILSTMHYGFFHMSIYPFQEEDLFVIVRPVPNKFIEAYMNKIRFKENMYYFAEHNIKNLLKNSDKFSKGVLITLNDVRKPLSKEKFEFFGLSTTASNFTAFYSMKENIPILVVHNVIDKNNIAHIYIDEILYPEDFKNKQELTNKILKIYEKIIIERPEQWFWFQEDRWIDGK